MSVLRTASFKSSFMSLSPAQAACTWRAILALIVCFVGVSKNAMAETPTAVTPSGTYEGIQAAGINKFLGIPYAQAPVGELRWQPPQPLPASEEPRQATEIGPSCLQRRAKRLTSEDCLTLNIWSASQERPKRPVMVWIHGGGFRSGSNDIAGEVLIRNEAGQDTPVVVALNYRLGPLGIFSHKSIKGKYANFALLDMIAALEWVQTNIAGFGGDPDNVTIFGVSAGGMAVNMLMTSPLSEGLFHKAIAQSGYGTWPLSHTRHARRRPALDLDGATLESAERISSNLVKTLSSNRQTRQMLYALDGLTLVNALDGFQLPYVDGHTLKAEPGIRFKQNKQHRVPFITGGNSNEGSVMPSSGVAVEAFAKGFGPDKKAIQKLYARDFARDDLSGWMRVFGDLRYLLAARVQGAAMASPTDAATVDESPTWLYYIDLVPDAYKSKWVGTPHGMDAWLLFNGHTSTEPDIAQFAEQLRSYWLNFAFTGNPNKGPEQTAPAETDTTSEDDSHWPHWPQYTEDTSQWLYMGKTPQARPDVIKQKLDLLEDRYNKRINPAFRSR